jgi:hypothetical protein
MPRPTLLVVEPEPLHPGALRPQAGDRNSQVLAGTQAPSNVDRLPRKKEQVGLKRDSSADSRRSLPVAHSRSDSSQTVLGFPQSVGHELSLGT